MIHVVIQHIVIDGILLSLALGLLVMGSLMVNPRLWLQDYPKAVQAKVPPINNQEKRQQRLMMVPFLLLMFGVPYVSVTMVKAANGGVVSFPFAYLTAAGVMHMFNLFDAVVLDYLILTKMKPSFALIPGTTWDEYSLEDIGLQVRNYMKGFVLCTVMGLPIALVGSL